MRHNSRRMKNRGQGSNNNTGHRRNNNVPPRMQVFDSNGPDVRIRGTAWQVHEKYMALAKDAASAGDVVMAENYSQHAEHYQRIINTFGEQTGNWAPQTAHNDDQSMDMDGEMAAPAVMQAQAQAQTHAAPAPAAAPRADRRDDGLGLPTSLFKAPAQPVLETA